MTEKSDNADKPHAIAPWKAALILLLVILGVALGSFFVVKMDQPGRTQERPSTRQESKP